MFNFNGESSSIDFGVEVGFAIQVIHAMLEQNSFISFKFLIDKLTINFLTSFFFIKILFAFNRRIFHLNLGWSINNTVEKGERMTLLDQGFGLHQESFYLWIHISLEILPLFIFLVA